MKKYENIAIFCDYDGTLSCISRGLHPENVDAIRYFTDNGGQFSLASGKALNDYYKMPFTANGPMLFSNGAEIYDLEKEEWIKRFVMDDRATELLQEIFYTWPELGITAHGLEELYCYRYNWSIIDKAHTHWYREPADIQRTEELKGSLLMVTAYGIDVQTDQVRELVTAKYPEFDCTTAFPRFLNITQGHVSKGDAIAYLKKHYYPEDSRPLIIAVGDNENDLEMFRESDISFAMGNAIPELKDMATVILEDDTHPCIPQILNYLDEVILPKGIHSK